MFQFQAISIVISLYGFSLLVLSGTPQTCAQANNSYSIKDLLQTITDTSERLSKVVKKLASDLTESGLTVPMANRVIETLETEVRNGVFYLDSNASNAIYELGQSGVLNNNNIGDVHEPLVDMFIGLAGEILQLVDQVANSSNVANTVISAAQNSINHMVFSFNCLLEPLNQLFKSTNTTATLGLIQLFNLTVQDQQSLSKQIIDIKTNSNLDETGKDNISGILYEIRKILKYLLKVLEIPSTVNEKVNVTSRELIKEIKKTIQLISGAVEYQGGYQEAGIIL